MRIVFFATALSLVLTVFTHSTSAARDGYIDWPASAGTATSALSSGPASFWGNPAGLLSCESLCAHFSAQREWGLDELSTYRFSVVKGSGRSTYAIGGGFTGDASLYTESTIGLSYSRELGPIDLGAKIDMLFVKSDDWSATTPVLSLGIATTPSEIVSIGAWADNITGSRLDGNHINMRGAIGAKIEPTDWIDISADCLIEEYHPPALRLGQEIFILSILTVRSGVVFRPNSYHFGLGLRHSGFAFDWAYIGHPELGGSTFLGLTYEGENDRQQ